jgi:hypothetical protein
VLSVLRSDPVLGSDAANSDDFDDAHEKSGVQLSLRRHLERRSTIGTRALLRIVDGDWGGARPEDIEVVARSVVEVLTQGVAGEVSIRIDATSGSPVALRRLSSRGEFIVHLSVQGNQWAQLSYQFAHEFCHILADVTTWRKDGFAWLEEALCETASLCALRSLARTWAIRTPYPDQPRYPAKFSAYAAWRMQDEARTLPTGVDFHEWLASQLPLLQADAQRRDDNTIIAQELLPIFEADPTAWRAVRYLHGWLRNDGATLAEFLSSWSQACPEDVRTVVQRLAEVLAGPARASIR